MKAITDVDIGIILVTDNKEFLYVRTRIARKGIKTLDVGSRSKCWPGGFGDLSCGPLRK